MFSSDVEVVCNGEKLGRCKENNSVVVAYSYFKAYVLGDVLLQDAFPMLSPEERDLIKFGLCDSCLWGEVEEQKVTAYENPRFGAGDAATWDAAILRAEILAEKGGE